MKQSGGPKGWCLWLHFLLVVGLAFSVGPAFAHKVTVFAWMEGDAIHTQSKFSGGKPAQNAAVAVYDRSGATLLDGSTSEKGEFSFGIPKKEDLTIVVTAGSGHRGEWTVTKADLEGGPGAVETADNRKSGDTGTSQPAAAGRDTPAGVDRINRAELQQIVEESLEKKIAPLRNMMVDAGQSRPTVKDVFGGIGYIVGIVGIAAYIRARRKNAGGV